MRCGSCSSASGGNDGLGFNSSGEVMDNSRFGVSGAVLRDVASAMIGIRA
jgi:hypothetical protein